MLYRISVAERGLTGIANIFRSRLSRLDDLLRAGTVPLTKNGLFPLRNFVSGIESVLIPKGWAMTPPLQKKTKSLLSSKHLKKTPKVPASNATGRYSATGRSYL